MNPAARQPPTDLPFREVRGPAVGCLCPRSFAKEQGANLLGQKLPVQRAKQAIQPQ